MIWQDKLFDVMIDNLEEIEAERAALLKAERAALLASERAARETLLVSERAAHAKETTWMMIIICILAVIIAVQILTRYYAKPKPGRANQNQNMANGH